MTAAELFYDKLLASIGYPGAEDSDRKNELAHKAETSKERMNSPPPPPPSRKSKAIPIVQPPPPKLEPPPPIPLKPALPSWSISRIDDSSPSPPASLTPSPAMGTAHTPVTLEAELRRKLLETSLSKWKPDLSSESPNTIADPADKNQNITPPQSKESPINVKANPSSHASDEDDRKFREAELRQKLLQTSALKRQSSSLSVQTKSSQKSGYQDRRSESHISISSDDELRAGEPAAEKLSADLRLPPRPPAREGFRLRISFSFPSTIDGVLSVKTDILPLETKIASIIELFGQPGEDDYLFFQHPDSSSVEDGEEGDQKLGQRFYYYYSETRADGGRAVEDQPVKRTKEWNALALASKLRGEATEFIPGGLDSVASEKSHKSEVKWVTRKTLEDVFNGAKKVVNCFLIRGLEDKERSRVFRNRWKRGVSHPVGVRGWEGHSENPAQVDAPSFSAGFQWGQREGNSEEVGMGEDDRPMDEGDEEGDWEYHDSSYDNDIPQAMNWNNQQAQFASALDPALHNAWTFHFDPHQPSTNAPGSWHPNPQNFPLHPQSAIHSPAFPPVPPGPDAMSWTQPDVGAGFAPGTGTVASGWNAGPSNFDTGSSAYGFSDNVTGPGPDAVHGEAGRGMHAGVHRGRGGKGDGGRGGKKEIGKRPRGGRLVKKKREAPRGGGGVGKGGRGGRGG